MNRLLRTIDEPARLHHLTRRELRQLCAEIRETIIATVSRTGGHLAASLGAVELAVALHSVLDTPRDKLIWDVGHQAYAHKLLTGRRGVFHTLRRLGGISGFPRREESIYDAFGTGHSSTSISAALGYALARDRLGQDHHVVAVIGDGALTGGMAFEALNHAGHIGARLIVVLNDNEMSIARNVGALSQYLTRLRSDPTLSRAREDMEQVLRRIPAIGDSMLKATDRFKRTIKQLFVPGLFFEELGFTYLGPIDGHDIGLLQNVLREAMRRQRPVLIHAITQKGRGYGPSEENPERYHGTNPPVFQSDKTTVELPSYSQVFGQGLIEQAEKNDRIVAITAAMPEGTGLGSFKERYPERFFDVAIAEQHAVTLAAGLAAGGLRPVVALYSTFLQRAYDQVLHDVCLQKLPVVFAVDRAGLVGEDGATHHGVFDLSYLRSIPNLQIMAPKDSRELLQMLDYALKQPGPVVIRYPRGKVHDPVLDELGVTQSPPLQTGRAEVLRQGSDVTLIAVGSMVATALAAAECLLARGIRAGVVNARWVKPLDEELLLQLASETRCLVTLEENVLAGGFGSAVLETLEMNDRLSDVKVRRLGVGDTFVEHGDRDSLLQLVGLDVKQVADKVAAIVQETRNTSQARVSVP